jgi:integrase
MATIRLKYVKEWVDANGTVRRYFRRHGRLFRLPGLPGSPEFMREYERALTVTEPALPSKVLHTVEPGSLEDLTRAWRKTPAYKALRPATKKTYDGILSGLLSKHGHRPVRTMRSEEVRRLMQAKADAPAAANNLLRMIRLLMQHAVQFGWRTDDPTRDVRPIRRKTEGFATWEEDDIARFRAFHGEGTRARLALELLLATGQRRGDVVRIGRQHVRDGVLSLRQEKTGAQVDIPVLPDLAAEIELHPKTSMTYLTTGDGAAYTPAGFGNWFRDQCNAAGLPGLSAHGLRKAAARRLAEAGCTDREIMAWTGHRTSKEVTRYTVAADRKRLAQAAGDKLTGANPEQKCLSENEGSRFVLSNPLKTQEK